VAAEKSRSCVGHHDQADVSADRVNPGIELFLEDFQQHEEFPYLEVFLLGRHIGTVGGFGCGAFVFSPIQTLFVNPDDYKYDTDGCEKPNLKKL
jgi:hypothetical protein